MEPKQKGGAIMLKWLKDFTMRVLKLSLLALILIVLINGLEVNLSFKGNGAREKAINILGKVKDSIRVASDINQLFR